MAEVRIYGDPVLRKKGSAVKAFDKKLRKLVKELAETMKEKDGVGLAAPQIGESVRIAVVDDTGGEEEPYILINPEITFFSEEREDFEEGCLSIPGINLKVNRPSYVTVTAYNEKGEQYTIENPSKLLARAVQHEIDHLDGILFVDRISSAQRQLVSGKLKKLAKSHRKKSMVA